jgi:uncharacterized protein YbaR (Trm112 family)
MTTKKKPEIVGLEKVLENISPEHRDGARQAVKEVFENAEPGKPIGKVVIPLPDGTRCCPKCKKKLKHPHTMQLPPGIGGGGLAGQLVTCLECRSCDQFYMVKAVQ